MSAEPNPRRVLVDIPDGPGGTRVTLALMKRLVKESNAQRVPEIRTLAEQITRGAGGKEFRREAELIHQWMTRNIRYTLDPDGMEMLRAPIYTLEAGNGDCDDMCILQASLLCSIGHPCRFVAIAQSPDYFNHVYVETLIGQEWVGSDVTELHGFGWKPDHNIVARMYQNV